MLFSRYFGQLALIVVAVAATPTPQEGGAGDVDECCCCSPAAEAIVCRNIPAGSHCMCPAIYCEPDLPKLKECCCCDECSLIPYDDSCNCLAVVCPEKSAQ